MEGQGMKDEMMESMGRIPGHDHDHGDMMGMFMCLAKDAHMELMKEKIKKKIDAAHGKKMDDTAAIIAEGMAMKMMMMMEAKKGKKDMMMKLEEIWMKG